MRGLKMKLTRNDAENVIHHLRDALLNDNDIEQAFEFGTGNGVLKTRADAIAILKNFGIELTTTYYGTVI